MEWKDISMHDRLALLKERRKENPGYKYFELRNEYNGGKDPLYNPATYQYIAAKKPNVDYTIPEDVKNFPKQNIIVDDSYTNPIKPINYEESTPWSVQYVKDNWELPQYNNSKYTPSKLIRDRIVNWEGSSMKTNAPIDVKAKELKQLIGNDILNRLSPEQLDSLTSYYYNIMPSSFTPTLNHLKQLNNAKSKQEYDNIIRNTANSINVGYNRKGMSGLRKRRMYEQNLFMNNKYDDGKDQFYNPQTFLGKSAKAFGLNPIKADLISTAISLSPVGVINNALDMGADVNDYIHGDNDVNTKDLALDVACMIPFVKAARFNMFKPVRLKIKGLKNSIIKNSYGAAKDYIHSQKNAKVLNRGLLFSHGLGNLDNVVGGYNYKLLKNYTK